MPRKSYFMPVSPAKLVADHMVSTPISQLKYAKNFANLAISSCFNIPGFSLSLDRDLCGSGARDNQYYGSTRKF